ncbi:SWIM zinc finger family protein [Streptomyces asiaticus]|uniref:SWIM zinc finger family protein n=4 Tax=Streptomyces TaxID=1883 RepID=A0ABP4A9M5_9ACTN
MGARTVADMNPQGERWTAEQVLALAPDAASRTAGGRLAAAGKWSGAGAHGPAVWGLCSGSGSKPYQTVVDLNGPGYRCSCPSRKFPCKHALGLLLLWASGEGGVPAGGESPEWAEQWLGDRRERAEKLAAGARDGGPGPGGGSGDGAGKGGSGGAADPEAARRRAERRAQRIAAGATELERRLADLLRDGLASADRAGYGAWDETAARMIDAQAPGLEARVRELAAIPSSGPGWPARLLEECALAHLLNQGFLHLDRLPEKLAATTRTRVGLTTPVAELLATEEAIRDRWLVLGRQDGTDGRLTTRRIWLRGERTHRMALLLSFSAPGQSPELALPTGLVLDADLAYYPAARPLRAALGTRHEEVAEDPPPTAPPAAAGCDMPRAPEGCDVETALAAYGAALGEDPWLDGWPVVLADVVPVPGDEGWQLADERSGSALPVDPRCAGRTDLWQLMAISGGGPVTVFGECGHRGFSPITTWDPTPVSLIGTAAQGGTR